MLCIVPATTVNFLLRQFASCLLSKHHRRKTTSSRCGTRIFSCHSLFDMIYKRLQSVQYRTTYCLADIPSECLWVAPSVLRQLLVLLFNKNKKTTERRTPRFIFVGLRHFLSFIIRAAFNQSESTKIVSAGWGNVARRNTTRKRGLSNNKVQ